MHAADKVSFIQGNPRHHELKLPGWDSNESVARYRPSLFRGP